MKIKLTVLALCIPLLQPTSSTGCEIHQINSLKEVTTADFQPKTLLLLDLDETILIDKDMTSQKYKHLINGTDGTTQYRLIESDITETIHNLKCCVANNNENVVVLGLTKRDRRQKTGQNKWDQGHKHLEDAKIDISRQRFSKFNDLELGKGLQLSGANASIEKRAFKNGVIYTNHQDKGDYLSDFLKKVNYQPNYIVMCDDKPDNLKSVAAYANKNGIPMKAYQMNGVKYLK